MRFTVDFKCDNDAFKPEERPEIVNCLQRIIELLRECKTAPAPVEALAVPIAAAAVPATGV